MPNATVLSTALTSSRRRLFKLIFLLGILTAFAPLSTDMYLAAFPAMAADLGTDVSRVQQSLAVFFLGLALGQLAYGPLSDRFGRKKPLMAGLLVYTLASALLAMTRDIHYFLLLRFIQAVGGCSGMIISRAVIQDCFDLKGSARVLTLMLAVQSLGPVVAPIIGAYLLSRAHWSVVFWLLTLLGIGCLTASKLVLPETLLPEKRIKQTPKAVLAVFGQLFSKRAFLFPTLAGAIGGSAIFSFISASPFVLMTLYKLDETQYGWTFAIISLGTSLFAQLNLVFLKKMPARRALGLGASLLTIMNLITLVVLAASGGLPDFKVFLPLLFLSLACIPLIFANSTALAMSNSGRFAGSASSLVGVSQFIFAGLVSFLVGIFHNGTIWPMIVAMAGCGLICLLILTIEKILLSYQ